MNREQKMAWLCVVMAIIGLVISLIVFGVLYFRIGMPKALLGFACVCIVGFAGLGPVIFRKDKGKVTVDERDRLIKRNAVLSGFTSAYLFTGLACMIPWFIIGPKGAISVNVLPNIFIYAGITHGLVYSVAILAQYGWRDKNHE